MELNWFCKECKLLNKTCDGNTNPIFSNCVFREHWLNNGNKVKIVKNNKIGVIKHWDWITQNYIVELDDGNCFPYQKSELQEFIL